MMWVDMIQQTPPKHERNYLVVKEYPALEKIEVCIEKWSEMLVIQNQGLDGVTVKKWMFKEHPYENVVITHWMPIPTFNVQVATCKPKILMVGQ